jgi:predicted enzyme related to lactoylglutathione lyase
MAKPVSYLELHTSDPAKAKAFYGQLFSWKFEELKIPGMYYESIRTGGELGGGLMKTDHPKAPPMWLSYLTVDDLDATVSKVRSLGGSVIKERTEVPGEGWFAVVADPTGATFALWQAASQRKQ